jgi:hypothetical protein
MKLAIRTFITIVILGFISTAVASESMTVDGLHTKRTELADKQISITGTVIKVNNGIMRRNFIHVQDGTGSGDTDRVIFTSKQTAKVGDKIMATGTVKLNVDFGMGYFYPTLVEQSTLKLVK